VDAPVAASREPTEFEVPLKMRNRQWIPNLTGPNLTGPNLTGPNRAGLNRPWLNRAGFVWGAAAALLFTPASWAQEPDAEALFQGRCALCHAADANAGAPDRATLSAFPPAAIVDAMRSGSMRQQAVGLSDAELQTLAEFLTGKQLTESVGAGEAGRCENPAAFVPGSQVLWSGWSPSSRNMRFHTAQAAGLSADQVAGLELRWAFGFEGASSARGLPAVVGGRVFVGGGIEGASAGVVIQIGIRPGRELCHGGVVVAIDQRQHDRADALGRRRVEIGAAGSEHGKAFGAGLARREQQVAVDRNLGTPPAPALTVLGRLVGYRTDAQLHHIRGEEEQRDH